MIDDVSVKPPGQVRGGYSNKADRATRRPATGISQQGDACCRGATRWRVRALTREAVEMALAGDPTALRLCMASCTRSKYPSGR
jgi:hypothetical protein